MDNDQNVRALCQLVQYSGKICQLHLQRVELLTDTRTGMLESFDEFGRSFVTGRFELVWVEFVVDSRIVVITQVAIRMI